MDLSARPAAIPHFLARAARCAACAALLAAAGASTHAAAQGYGGAPASAPVQGYGGTPANAAAQGYGGAPAPAAANNATSPLLPTQDQAQQLFAKGTVNGEDLKQELLVIKAAAANPAAQSALAAIIGPASTQMASGTTHSFFTDLGGKIKEFAGDLLQKKTVSYSDKVLNDFLTALTADDDALRKETITLPSGANLTLSQQQSVLIMASLLVGTRIAHHIVDSAHRDFAGLEGEYAALLNKRQEQAALLTRDLDKRRQAPAADLGLSPADLQFVDAFGPDTPLQQVDDDLGMQNLGLQYMQHRDPGGYGQFREQQKGLIGRSRAYLKVTAGVAAFGAFSVAFVKEIVKTAQDKNMSQIFAALPFAGDYIKEAVPLIKLSADTLALGLSTEPNSLKHHYRLIQHQKTLDVKDAAAVFDALNRSKDSIYFSEALFRNESPGYLYHIYLCDPGAAGAMIDHAVTPASRKSFAEQFLRVPDGSAFSFADALNDGARTPAGQPLAESLLSRDYRIGAEAAAIGEIQRQTVSAYAKWNTTELTQLIIANAQGVYTQLSVGDTLIRVIPSMATIYTYDSYADGCHAAKRDTAPDTKAGPDTKASPDTKAPKKKPVKPKQPPQPNPNDLTL
jgi:hypothetical protein